MKILVKKRVIYVVYKISESREAEKRQNDIKKVVRNFGR